MSEDIVAANNNGIEETADTESETALGEGRIIDLITGERELKTLYWLLGTSVPKIDNLVYHHPPIFFVM